MDMRKKIVALLKQLQARVKEFINMLLAVLKGKSVAEAKRASALSQNKGKIILGVLGALTIAAASYSLNSLNTIGKAALHENKLENQGIKKNLQAGVSVVRNYKHIMPGKVKALRMIVLPKATVKELHSEAEKRKDLIKLHQLLAEADHKLVEGVKPTEE